MVTLNIRTLTAAVTLLALCGTGISAAAFADGPSPLQQAVKGCFVSEADDLVSEQACLITMMTSANIANAKRTDELGRCYESYWNDSSIRHLCASEVVDQAKIDFENLNKRALVGTGAAVSMGIIGTFVYRFLSGAAGIMIIPTTLLKNINAPESDGPRASVPQEKNKLAPAS